jgi:hypothetical protein
MEMDGSFFMGEKKRIVVILGMHRCGTSVLSMFLNAIGIDFGRNFRPHDEWNAEGYWENKDILAIHEKILDELKSEWKDPRIFLDPDWPHRPEIQDLKHRLLETVRSETGKTQSIWGFKDPRTSILLPIWRDIFGELELEPSFLLAVRSPGAVAASLERRDGLSGPHSQLLWLKHNLNALAHAGNDIRTVVDYDGWFEPGFKQARMVVDSLMLPWEVGEERLAEAIDLAIRPQLRHHQPRKHEDCSPTVERLYTNLSEAAATGTIPEESREIIAGIEKVSDVLNLWSEVFSKSDSQLTKTGRLLRHQRKNLQVSFGIIVALVVFLLGFFVLTRF